MEIENQVLSTASQQHVLELIEQRQQSSRAANKINLFLGLGTIALGGLLWALFPAAAAGFNVAGLGAVLTGGYITGRLLELRALDKAKQGVGEESFIARMAKKAARLAKIDKFSRGALLTAIAVASAFAIGGFLFPAAAALTAVLSNAAFGAALVPMAVNMLSHDSAQSAKAVSVAAVLCATDDKLAALAAEKKGAPALLTAPQPGPAFTQAVNANTNAPPQPETAPVNKKLWPRPKN